VESLKALDSILTPDSRNEAFVKVDRETGDFVPMELADYFRYVCEITLKDTIPPDIRSYMETIKNVYLYGWFVYPFFTLAGFLSYTAIEMGLREKFRHDDPMRKWPLKRLLEEAKTRRLISDEGFPSVQTLREQQAYLSQAMGSPFDRQIADYCSILIETIPHLRNSFAHPKSQTILTPSMAVRSLVVAAELLNQLFQAGVSGAGDSGASQAGAL